MSIRAKLAIAVLAALILAAGGVASMLFAQSRVSSADEKESIVEDMVTTLLKLNVLRAEYQLTASERSLQQWFSQNRQLEQLFSEAARAYPDGNEIVDRLRENNRERLELFDELRASIEARTGTDNPPVTSMDEEVVVGRLLVLSQRILEETDLLYASSNAELDAARSLLTIFSTLFMCLLALVVLLMAFLVGATVLKSVSKFTVGAEAVASGDLEYHIDLKRKDEIGEAASVFNRMTDSLRASTRELELSRENLEEMVKLRTAELERANAELDAYASVVSHDLRSPLASAATANEILMIAVDDVGEMVLRERFVEFTGLIKRALEKALELVSSLLELAGAGQKPVHITEVPVSGVVDELLQDFQPLIEERSTRFEIDGDLGVIRGDRTQVYQVFANLISNSMRHNDNANPVTMVKYLGVEDGLHRYIVRDNGPGFDEGDFDKIFKPLYKGAQTSDIGLGLSIVHKIINAYGGRIRAYNDMGACFEFEIPDWSDA
jgi:signal transduction histidine kinase